MKPLSPDNAYSEQMLATRCARAEAEVERLRAALNDALPIVCRNGLIEECARVADQFRHATDIAAAIRALKEEP